MSDDSVTAAFEARVLAKMAELEAEAREAAFERLIEQEARNRLAAKRAAADAELAAVREAAEAEQKVQQLKETIADLQYTIKQLEAGQKLLQDQMKPYEQYKAPYYGHNANTIHGKLEAQVRYLVAQRTSKSELLAKYDEKLRKAEVAAGQRLYEYDYPSQEVLKAHIEKYKIHTGLDAVTINCSCGMPAGIWKPGMAYPPSCCMHSDLCGQPGYDGKMHVY